MSFRSLNLFQRLSLRRVLVIPFVLQVFIAVGLTGLLSIRNGQQAVNDVTAQLREEVTARIQQQVQEAIATPQTLMTMNESLINMGVVRLGDRTFLEQYLIRQLQAFPSLGELSFTTSEGQYLSVERRDDKLNLLASDRANSEDLHRYQLRADGSIATLLEISPNFNPQHQPNYMAALEGRDRTWGEIYTNTDSEFLELQSLSLPLVQPMYSRQNQLLGVWEAELRLTQIGDFLRSLEIGKSGQAFIIERSGLLVASSTLEQPFLITYGSTLRIKAQNSIDPLIQAAATYLQDNVNLKTLDRLEPLEFKLQGERQFLQITPISDPFGLDWLIVVVVPEQDFMGRIQANTRLTIALCLVALSISVLIGWLTARWLTQPLWNLIQATRAIAQGDWDQIVKHGSILEIRQLAETFNQMAQQLKSSFAALAQANEQLEARVEERTAALTVAERELRGLFESMSELVFVKDSEGRYVKIPSSQPRLALIYGDLDALIGKTDAELLPLDYGAEFLGYIHQVLTHQQMLTVEYALPLTQDHQQTLVWFGANISPIGSDQVLWVARDITARKQAEQALQIQQNRVEALLRNILPDAIAERLKTNTDLVADYFEQVTILFVDIVGFSRISSELAPSELVTWLNQLFSCFDQLADWHDLEKIKTIGDAYMVVGGLPVPREDHATAIADFALDIQTAMSNFRTPAGEPIHIRIGIHSGPVVAGVIGLSKFSYDLWGKAVNLASRMESQGKADHIQVSQVTYELLRSHFLLTERGQIDIRGFGAMPTYWLMSRQ